jgi:hypothetical protein
MPQVPAGVCATAMPELGPKLTNRRVLVQEHGFVIRPARSARNPAGASPAPLAEVLDHVFEQAAKVGSDREPDAEASTTGSDSKRSARQH